MKRKEGGRGLKGVERCVREKENSLGFYVAYWSDAKDCLVGYCKDIGQVLEL